MCSCNCVRGGMYVHVWENVCACVGECVCMCGRMCVRVWEIACACLRECVRVSVCVLHDENVCIDVSSTGIPGNREPNEN